MEHQTIFKLEVKHPNIKHLRCLDECFLLVSKKKLLYDTFNTIQKSVKFFK